MKKVALIAIALILSSTACIQKKAEAKEWACPECGCLKSANCGCTEYECVCKKQNKACSGKGCKHPH